MSGRKLALAAALLAGTALAGPARAADKADVAAVRDNAKVVRLSDWNVEPFRNGGWTANEMRGQTVYDRKGDDVGTVQSIVMDRDGQVKRLAVETGGFLDVGDKVIGIPWDKISLTPGKKGIQADVNADNIENFSLFGDREKAKTGPGTFLASDIIGDDVLLGDNANYGYVHDLLFDKQGKLQAIVAVPDIGWKGKGGYYAYPWYGSEPGLGAYTLPYTAKDLAGYGPFDYGAWHDGIV